MNHLIVGFGEIGNAVYQVIEPGADTIFVVDPVAEIHNDTPDTVAVMHVCFPYTEQFFEQVDDYSKEYSPEHVVIYSTVPIGTTKRLFRAVHSPVEGKHPDLELSIRHMERWIGYNDIHEANFFYNFFHEQGLRVRTVANSDFTEALKLLSTTEYGINIEFARYKAVVAEAIGMDYQLTKDWNLEYNRLYRNLGLDKKYQKFILDAPEGPKGGHCVVPNARLLDQQYPDGMVKIVGEIL